MNKEHTIKWGRKHPWSYKTYSGEATPFLFADYARGSIHAGRYCICAIWFPLVPTPSGVFRAPPAARLHYYNDFDAFERDLSTGAFVERPGGWIPCAEIKTTIVDEQSNLTHVHEGDELPKRSHAEIITS